MNEEDLVWHRETADADVERTLRDLHTLPILTPFYLAGGTGLALRLAWIIHDFTGEKGKDALKGVMNTGF